MFYNILEGEVNPQSGIFLWVIVGFMVIFLVYSFISGNKRRKKMAEEQEKRNDIHPGYRVTTIGGIVGTVEEVDNDANTFVLKTGVFGNESYIKFDKQAIYLSENPNAKTEEEAVSAQNADAEQIFDGNDGEEPTAAETVKDETSEEAAEATEEVTEEKE